MRSRSICRPGLTVLTGETGAGKSMLVDAIELLSGGRAGAEVVRAGADRAELSATVDISKVGGELRHILEEQSITHEGELLLRRVGRQRWTKPCLDQRAERAGHGAARRSANSCSTSTASTNSSR